MSLGSWVDYLQEHWGWDFYHLHKEIRYGNWKHVVDVKQWVLIRDNLLENIEQTKHSLKYSVYLLSFHHILGDKYIIYWFIYCSFNINEQNSNSSSINNADNRNLGFANNKKLFSNISCTHFVRMRYSFGMEKDWLEGKRPDIKSVSRFSLQWLTIPGPMRGERHKNRVQFMANKQFRMEKKIGNISVRWYLTICSQKPIR